MSTLDKSCLFVALLMVLSAPFSKANANANANAIYLPWEGNMVPGQGFDSARLSSKKTSPVESFNLALDQSSLGMDKLGLAVCPFERKFDMELVDSVSEYERKIGVTAEAEINVVVATATGTLSFREHEIDNRASVYLMIRDERINCHYRLKNPKLSVAAEQAFAQDYPAFRAMYGDSFLSTVTTGGSFYALMKITSTRNETHDELKFRLKAKVWGVTVFSWGMEEVLDDIQEDSDVTIKVLSNGSQHLAGVTKERMLELYQEYLAAVTSPVCSGNSASLGPGECPFRKVSYESFQQITRAAPGSTGAQAALMAKLAQQTAIMDELAQRRRGYADLEVRAADVEANIDAYAYPRPQDEAIKLQKVQQLRESARVLKESLEDKYDACVGDPMLCAAPTPSELTPSELALEREFPVKVDQYPQTCKELHKRYGVSRDGRFQLYWQGKRSQSFQAYCTEMLSAEPQTYLLFGVSSAMPKREPEDEKTVMMRPAVNFARRVATPDYSVDEPRVVTSVLAGLHVRFSNGQAIVLPQGGVLVKNYGGPFQEGALEIQSAEVFAPKSCDAGGERHLANLSLHGTPWVLSSQNSYRSNVPTEGAWTVSADRKQLDAHGEGRTGCVELSVQGQLLLEYQP